MTTMTSSVAGPERGLLRVHVWVVLLVTLLCLGTAAIVALTRPPAYVATAEVQVQTPLTTGAGIAPAMATEREIATSGAVSLAAATRLGVSTTRASDGLEVSVVTDAAVLRIEYTATTPRAAHEGADAFTRAYVDYRNVQQTARVATVITPAGTAHRDATAELLVVPVGLMVGLLLGVATAWVWDRVSDRVRSAQELERTGAPVVASGLALSHVEPLALSDRGEREFDFLAGRLRSMLDDHGDGGCILVTAPRADQTTGALAFHTAVALAALGMRVVLVDADLSSPGVTSLLGAADHEHGFEEVLAGMCSADRALVPLAVPGVRLLPSRSSGPRPRSDADLGLVLSDLASRDVVLVVGPPVIDCPETVVLAGHADVVALVGVLRNLRRRDVAEVLRLLEPAGATRICWVLRSVGRGRPQPPLAAPAGQPLARDATGGPRPTRPVPVADGRPHDG
jgi:Mrp family chromosome partitioning ATPase